MFSRWANIVNRVFGFPPAHRRVRLRTVPRRTRPTIEALEDRCLLSSYTVTDLGTFGGPDSFAAGINSVGEVVGYADTNNYFVQTNTRDSGKVTKVKVYQEEPFLWPPSAPNGTKGSLIDIGNQQGWYNDANGINDHGQVACRVYLNNGAPQAFLWNPSTANGTTGTLIDLGSLGGPNSEATDINSAGQVVGDANTSSGGNDAFLWTPTTPNGSSGSMIALGTISYVTGINDSGEVVGSSISTPVGVFDNNAPSAAFLYSGGRVSNLGSLGGSSFQDASLAYAINSYGQVVGTSDVNNSDSHAFLWTPTTPHGTTGTMIDLGTLGSGDSAAYSINSAGQVVGEDFGAGHAFLWTPKTPNGTTGTMIDLNPLVGGNGITLWSATGINDTGQIVGVGSRSSNIRAVLLTPTTTTTALVQPASSTSTTTLASPTVVTSNGTPLAPTQAQPATGAQTASTSSPLLARSIGAAPLLVGPPIVPPSATKPSAPTAQPAEPLRADHPHQLPADGTTGPVQLVRVSQPAAATAAAHHRVLDSVFEDLGAELGL
jgi:probable HAF family extracellular repeat protein